MEQINSIEASTGSEEDCIESINGLLKDVQKKHTVRVVSITRECNDGVVWIVCWYVSTLKLEYSTLKYGSHIAAIVPME